MTSFFNEEFIIFTVTFLTTWLAWYGGKYAQTGVNSFAMIIRSKNSAFTMYRLMMNLSDVRLRIYNSNSGEILLDSFEGEYCLSLKNKKFQLTPYQF